MRRLSCECALTAMHVLFYSPEVPKLCVIGCGYGSSRDAAIVASRHPAATLYGSVASSVRTQPALLCWTVLSVEEFVCESVEWEQQEGTTDTLVAWFLEFCIARKRPVFELAPAVTSSRPANRYTLSKQIIEQKIRKKGNTQQWRVVREQQLCEWFTSLQPGVAEACEGGSADYDSLLSQLLQDLDGAGGTQRATPSKSHRKKRPQRGR